MKTDTIVLSISMLISGQENMDKSLSSLRFFKEALPCEIILVDTGCTAEGRTLAEQVADQIIDFNWCNDFAAARNAGLKKCKGQWFLYLDDDEWFENPRAIIEFFQSGEYKNYNSALYYVRNYFDSQGTVYENVPVSRMIKLEPYTEFRGKIHEYLYPYKEPKKLLTDFVHHYGYVFKDENEARKHAERNIRPLVEMMKQEPKQLRWRMQLAQEYFGIKKYDEAITVCQNALEEWHKKELRSETGFREAGCLYGFMILSFEAIEKLDLAGEWCEKALRELHMPECTRAFFYLMGIRVYGKLSHCEKCQECTEKYLNYYDRLKDDTAAIDEGTTLITSTVFQPHNMAPSFILGIPTLIRTQNYKLIRRVFFTVDWQDSRLLEQNAHELRILDACCSADYNPLWVEMLQTLVSRPDGMREMYSVFLQKEIEYKTQNETEKLLRLRRLVSELDYPHKYILYTKILWIDKDPEIYSEEERQVKLTKLFIRLFEEYPKDILDIKEEVWDVAENRKINVGSMMERMKFATWKHDLDNWVLEASLEKIQEWQSRMQSWKQSEDARYKVFQIKYLEGTLRNCKASLYSMSEVERLFWQCSDAILDLYSPCYTEAAFTQTPELLPDEIQFALQLQTLRQAREQGADRDVLEALRALNDTYEPMNGVIAYYAKLYREEVHNRNDEMAQLAAGLKRNVRILINAGKLDDAKAVIIQLEQFIPGDEELQAFKEELQMN